MNKREIIVFATKGGKTKYDTDISTWGELKALIVGHYDLENLQAVENINKTTLIQEDAKLPESNFVLFLRPIKTKSGINVENKNFLELREIVKEYKESHGDIFLEHINVNGNYTRLSTDDLRGLLRTFEEDDDKDECEKHDSIYEINIAIDTLEDYILNPDEYYEVQKIIERLNNIRLYTAEKKVPPLSDEDRALKQELDELENY